MTSDSLHNHKGHRYLVRRHGRIRTSRRAASYSSTGAPRNAIRNRLGSVKTRCTTATRPGWPTRTCAKRCSSTSFSRAAITPRASPPSGAGRRGASIYGAAFCNCGRGWTEGTRRGATRVPTTKGSNTDTTSATNSPRSPTKSATGHSLTPSRPLPTWLVTRFGFGRFGLRVRPIGPPNSLSALRSFRTRRHPFGPPSGIYSASAGSGGLRTPATRRFRRAGGARRTISSTESGIRTRPRLGTTNHRRT